MSRSVFENALQGIRSDIQTLGGMVTNGITRAVASLVARDLAEAREVKKDDKQADQLRYRIEDECMRIIATQQPVARDLRLLVSTTFVAVELERCGDYAKGVAKAARRIARCDSGLGPYNITDMDRVARGMIDQCLKAFDTSDTELAKKIIADDDYIDKLYNDLVVYCTTMMSSEPSHIECGVWLLHAGHCLERIGDRATNIAERVLFIESGVLGDQNVHLPEAARKITSGIL